MEEIRQIKIEDQEYPELLKEIPDAPKVLWYQGSLPAASAKCIAVVGTRRPSDYGQQVTLKIAGELADAGLVIVSGLAPGIDTFAHKICVEKGAPTIAVLGTGLDEKSVYPQSNLALSKEIIKTGGCLISELPPGTHGSMYSFPKRNRIISALSLGILVVEAKEKSGSLITATYAKKQKKKLFAIPGPIYSLNSRGPNKLIKEGAILTESADSILQELKVAPAKKQQVLVGENETEQTILNVLQEEALYIDAIIKKSNLSPSIIATSLALMEISGKIRNLGGNVYSLN